MRLTKKINGSKSSRPKRRAAKTSFSDACEWLLLQYEDIDRKFRIVPTDQPAADGATARRTFS